MKTNEYKTIQQKQNQKSKIFIYIYVGAYACVKRDRNWEKRCSKTTSDEVGKMMMKMDQKKNNKDENY